MAISQFPVPESGIPTGNTAGRPASPVIGDVYYNGQLSILEIFDGTNFVACSAPAAAPTIAIADVGTSVAYGSAQGLVTITQGTVGGPANSFLISASTGGYTATTTGTTVTITVGNNGSWTFSGQGTNNFGTSVTGPSSTATLTTIPQAPTIGTATQSVSSTDVTVTWTLNNNGGKNLSSITVTPYLNGTTAQTATTAATTSSTSATIVGLTQGSSYTFKVKTTNANGTSLESSASNSVTIAQLVSVNYLVVAGGGGGGSNASTTNNEAGGGGAGGLRSSVTATGGGGSLESALNVPVSTNVTVTVGSGGGGGVYNTTAPGNGNNSIFSTITSTGGGKGGSVVPGPGWASAGNGGSGGGKGGAGTVGTGTANQGFDGQNIGGGGGGGAGEAGGTDGSNLGGDGVAVSITGSSVTYGGGGSGSNNNQAGGTGGGGESNGGFGGTNLGGGGGSGPTGGGGAGGSGVVILRWLTADASITVGAGLTADATGTDGSHSYKRFTAGSGNVSFA